MGRAFRWCNTRMQQTLKSSVQCVGVGLHSGADVTMVINPAGADHGIVFVRTDVTNGDNRIPARWDHVVDTRMCTVVANKNGASVGTIEHLMAALRGCGVDNALIELNGPEIPVMDGSSAPFVALIDSVGTKAQESPRRAIRVLKEVEVRDGDKVVRLRPSNGAVFGGAIDFNHPSIGHQTYQTRLVNGNFRHDIADARTFGFVQEVEALRAAGLARGGSLDNAIVLNDAGVMNDGGLRFVDEFIRHKLLDAIGDLYLAGGPIIGEYDGFKAGHALNNQILHVLFSTPGAWVPVDLFVEYDAMNDGVLSAVPDDARVGSVAIA